MNEDVASRQDSPGRTIAVVAFGDTADEIEMAALDEARAFFGDRRLEVIRDYAVQDAISSIDVDRESGKKYRAQVCVRVVDPS
jgi:hypothetical protein